MPIVDGNHIGNAELDLAWSKFGLGKEADLWRLYRPLQGPKRPSFVGKTCGCDDFKKICSYVYTDREMSYLNPHFL